MTNGVVCILSKFFLIGFILYSALMMFSVFSAHKAVDKINTKGG